MMNERQRTSLYSSFIIHHSFAPSLTVGLPQHHPLAHARGTVLRFQCLRVERLRPRLCVVLGLAAVAAGCLTICFLTSAATVLTGTAALTTSVPPSVRLTTVLSTFSALRASAASLLFFFAASSASAVWSATRPILMRPLSALACSGSSVTSAA